MMEAQKWTKPYCGLTYYHPNFPAYVGISRAYGIVEFNELWAEGAIMNTRVFGFNRHQPKLFRRAEYATQEEMVAAAKIYIEGKFEGLSQ